MCPEVPEGYKGPKVYQIEERLCFKCLFGDLEILNAG